MTTPTNDIIIAGGGLAGLVQAIALAHEDIPSTIVEKGTHELHQQRGFDGRTSFLSLGNKILLKKWDVWKDMKPHAEPIKDIRIVDGDSPLFLHYDHEDVGVNEMGYIIENFYFRNALIKAVQENPLITVLENMSVEKADADSHFTTLTLSNGEQLKGKLLIVAEGRNSTLREKAGITVRKHDYEQTAIICALAHEKNHENIAIEKFLPSGPFAILPMTGGFHSAIVWSERSDLAPHFMAMDDAAFTAAVTERFTDYLGKLTLASPRWQYPLSLSFATRLYGERLALVGDAAHFIHPIAGQGFNQSMKDIAGLSRLLADRRDVGLDMGTEDVLKTYNRERKFDNLKMIAATDGLNRLFSNNLKTAKLARQIGLGLVQKSSTIKKAFMRHAMATKNSA